MNALQEVQDIVSRNNLEILAIRCTYNSTGIWFSKDIPIKTLEDLDFEYNNKKGVQTLWGIIYCKTKDTEEPVWLTRREHNGAEWWIVNSVPSFYKNFL